MRSVGYATICEASKRHLSGFYAIYARTVSEMKSEGHVENFRFG